MTDGLQLALCGREFDPRLPFCPLGRPASFKGLVTFLAVLTTQLSLHGNSPYGGALCCIFSRYLCLFATKICINVIISCKKPMPFGSAYLTCLPECSMALVPISRMYQVIALSLIMQLMSSDPPFGQHILVHYNQAVWLTVSHTNQPLVESGNWQYSDTSLIQT